MAAPSMLADTQSKVPPAVTEALRTGDHVPDERLRSLSEFTRTMVTGRGRPSEEDLQKFLNDGFTSEQVLQIVLAVGVKTFSNYANHMCHTPVDAAFEHRKWTKPRSPSHL